MILNGNQRGYGQELARHLVNTQDNEYVELNELRGFMSHDLAGAFYEVEAISKATRCRQYLYSLSLNPPRDAEATLADFEAAIERAEDRLGLSGQPRAVVFHVKDGRRHAHVVWSRIDAESLKSRQLSHDREKLTALSRELFREHGWTMPKGLQQRGERDPLHYDFAHAKQAGRSGKDPKQIKCEIREAWERSDCKSSFEQALAEQGYVLARGDRRGYVAVDALGEIYSIPRMAGVKTREVRARLGDPALLPSIEEVRQHLAEQQPQPETPYTAADALTRITRFHSAFTETMMDRALKPVIPDAGQREAMLEHLKQSSELLQIGTEGGRPVYATHDMQSLEQSIAGMADAMINTPSHRVTDSAIRQAMDDLSTSISKKTGGKGCLSEQQKQALKHMAGDRQLSLVVGVAGAGKTTIMEGAMAALQEQGYRVRGAAPSGIAASGLQEIGMTALTLHSLEGRIAMAQQMMAEQEGKPLTAKQQAYIRNTMLSPKDVLIIDEAGMVSAKQLSRVMELCKQSGAKLVLVGDPQQLQSIEAGTAFRDLLDRHDSVSLTEVRRQQPDWQQQATLRFSQGDIAGGLAPYRRHGCISTGHASRSAAKDALVTELMQARDSQPEQKRLVLAYTRKDVDDLNRRIRAEMIERGVVGQDHTDIRLTLKAGDEEIETTQAFAIGDRILFRENNKELGVMNGTFGTLQAIENGAFTVTLDSGERMTFSPQEYNRFQLGYAATVHKSQGVTVDETYVLATPHFDQHTSYVAMSRHKHQVKLFGAKTDFRNHDRLAMTLGKTGDKLSTLAMLRDNASEATRPVTTRLRRAWQRLRGKDEAAGQPEHPAPGAQAQPRAAKPHQTAPAHPHASSSSPASDKPLSHDDMAALRDQYIRQSTEQKKAKVQRQPHQPRPRGPGLER